MCSTMAAWISPRTVSSLPRLCPPLYSTRRAPGIAGDQFVEGPSGLDWNKRIVPTVQHERRHRQLLETFFVGRELGGRPRVDGEALPRPALPAPVDPAPRVIDRHGLFDNALEPGRHVWVRLVGADELHNR